MPSATQDATLPLEFAALVDVASPSHASLPLATPAALDAALLLRLADHHRVLGLLADCLRQAPAGAPQFPPQTIAHLRDWRRAHAAFTLQLTSELFRLLDAFASHSLEFLVTKGPALSLRCYGDPAVRQYTDLDLVLRDRDIARATQLMLELGYLPVIPLTAIAAKKIPGEYNFTKPGTPLLIEFHTERTFRYHPRPLPIDRVFARRSSVLIDSRSVPSLSLADELLLISIHGTKHFWERLMWIADVAALIARASAASARPATATQTNESLNWDLVLSATEEVRAHRILNLALLLASDLLAAPLPPAIDSAAHADRTAVHLATQIRSRLAASARASTAAFLESPPLSLLQRAVFRVRMRGNPLDGAAYLLRLTFSPTEEDWSPAPVADPATEISASAADTRTAAPPSSTIRESLARLFRLAHKHSRHP